MIDKTLIETNRGQVTRVTFTLPQSIWADTIYLVGEFNNWNNTSHPFKRIREGEWVIAVDLEPGRSYQFRYLRDGEWMNDSHADGYVHNPYGSDNFLVETNPNVKQHEESEGS